MFTKAYWNERAKQFGHTGHSEPFYYCFDQEARLYAINEVLKKINHPKNKALDFGCGSGDFVELLIENYQHVDGYEIAETMVELTAKRFSNSNIVISNCLENLTDYSYNLILSVTVFQVLVKEELNKTVKRLQQLLGDDGTIVSMEFFSTPEHNIKSKDHKTTEADWLEILSDNHLTVASTLFFYNPVTHPSGSWNKYNYNPMLRVLRLFKNYQFAQKIFKQVAKKLINKYKDVLLDDSFCKIYIITKEN